MASKKEYIKLLQEVIKLVSLVLGTPVIIDGWEVLGFGVIVDYHKTGWETKGFCRIDWKEFPKTVDVELFKELGKHKVSLSKG